MPGYGGISAGVRDGRVLDPRCEGAMRVSVAKAQTNNLASNFLANISRCSIEYLLLHGRGEGGVEGNNRYWPGIGAGFDILTGLVTS